MSQRRSATGTADNAPEVDQVIMSSEDRAIFNRVKSASDDWKDEVSVEEIADFSLAKDPFELPPPALKLSRERMYAFKWITRDPRRLDQELNKHKVMRWYPVNSTSPNTDFTAYIDKNNGAVCREDQMLMFKPFKAFEIERQSVMRNAEAALESKDLMNKGGDDFSSAHRKITDTKSRREEVKSSDIHFQGEAEIDAAAGVNIPMATEDEGFSED